MIKRVKLSREEKVIENALLKGEYVSVPKKAFQEIVKAIVRKNKSGRVKS